MNAKHYTTAPEDRIPLGQKIAFGAGMLGNQMFPAALSIFMVVLVKGLGMDPAQTVVTGDIGCTILGINEPFE